MVLIRFHTFQLQWCCTVTDKSSCGCFGSGSNPCVLKTHHGGGALWFVNQGWLVEHGWTPSIETPVLVRECSVLFCVGKLVTDWYSLRKVLTHLTVQSLVFSGSFTVKRIETVAVHLTVDTERNGDSRRTCANDEHVARTTSRLESRDLEVYSRKIKSSDRLAHQGWERLRLQFDKQFRQRFLMRTHDRVNDKVWSTSKVMGNLQRSRASLRDSPSGSGRPRGF